MVLQENGADFFESHLDRRHLFDDVDTVFFALKHADDTVDMTQNAF